MLWNHVFCPIVLYTNPSWAECVYTHLHHVMLWTFCTKTIAKMWQKYQHVGHISSDLPYMLLFYVIFTIAVSVISNHKNVQWRKWWETHKAQLESVHVSNTVGQSASSNTRVWNRHYVEYSKSSKWFRHLYTFICTSQIFCLHLLLIPAYTRVQFNAYTAIACY